jgi:regulator of cell morphogenesis and NO signaling
MDNEMTVREIVKQDYRTADVFKKWGINYCCGGNVSLNKICEQQKIDTVALEKDCTKQVKELLFPMILLLRIGLLIFSLIM